MATFYNQATLTYNGVTKSSNITSAEITEVISAEKTAVRGTYSPGDSIVYVISMINTGGVPLTGLTVTDDLGEYEAGEQTLVPLTFVEGSLLYYVNGELQTAPTVASQSPLTFSGIELPAQGTAKIIYETKVNEYASPETGGSVTNTAVISTDAQAVLATVTETVTAAASAQLDISKSVAPLTVVENGRVTYTFIIANTGNTAAEAADNAVVTDVFTPALDGLEVTFNGSEWTEGVDYTYEADTGTFVTSDGRITVPAAQYARSGQGGYIVTPGTSVLTVSGTLVPSQQVSGADTP